MPFATSNQSNDKSATFLKKIPPFIWWVIGGGLAILFLVAIVVWVPVWQAGQIAQSLTTGSPEVIFEIENKARSTILQGLSGLGLSTAAIVALLNLRETEKNRKIAEDKQVTERFMKAVEMLADEERLEVRLGGIYALERIAKDSPRDHWTILEILTAYIKKKSPLKNEFELERRDEISVDIQAALDVIGFQQSPEGRRVNLSGLDLRKATFRNGHLANVDFTAVNLSQAEFENIALRRAEIGGWLHNTSFLQADLTESDFGMADLKGASFCGCILEKSSFCGADLKAARFHSTNLNQADFTTADLAGASFEGADLNGVKFSIANLDGADFRKAKNLNLELIKEANNWKKSLYELTIAEQLGLSVDEQRAKHEQKSKEFNKAFRSTLLNTFSPAHLKRLGMLDTEHNELDSNM